MALAPLSSKQVDAYLKHLEVPEETIQALRLGPSSPGALKAVTRLQQCHLAKVPFENLDMHYSTFGYMQLDSEVVFDRIVGRNRGGLCFEAHPLLARLLMSLGFSLYLTGGRLNAVARLGANPKLDKSKLHYNSPW